MSNDWKKELAQAKSLMETDSAQLASSKAHFYNKESGSHDIVRPEAPIENLEQSTRKLLHEVSPTEIQKAIGRFKRDILERSVSDAVRRNVVFGESVLLNYDQMFDLRNEISENFKIHPSEIVLVGSGKLGFSIKPGNRYNPFHDKSDLDVAIVSPHLFEQLWQEIFSYSVSNHLWRNSDEAKKFRKYLCRGWLRPDMMPLNAFEPSQRWFDFFNDLTSQERYGPYPVKAGIYRSWFFFEEYQSICVGQCKQELEVVEGTK